MIPHREAQQIGAMLLRHLGYKLSMQEACGYCGCSPITAAEAGVLRQMLKDNQAYAVAEETPPPQVTRPAGPVAFPVQQPQQVQPTTPQPVQPAQTPLQLVHRAQHVEQVQQKKA